MESFPKIRKQAKRKKKTFINLSLADEATKLKTFVGRNASTLDARLRVTLMERKELCQSPERLEHKCNNQQNLTRHDSAS